MKIDQLPAAPVPTSASEPRDLEVKGKRAGQRLGSAPTDSRGDELKGSTVLCFQDPEPSTKSRSYMSAPNLSSGRLNT